jgi:hypothetical protein
VLCVVVADRASGRIEQVLSGGNMADSSRVAKELRECEKEQELSGITAVAVGGSLSHITGADYNRWLRWYGRVTVLLCIERRHVKGSRGVSVRRGHFHCRYRDSSELSFWCVSPFILSNEMLRRAHTELPNCTHSLSHRAPKDEVRNKNLAP